MLHKLASKILYCLRWPGRMMRVRAFKANAYIEGGENSNTTSGKSAICKNTSGKKENVRIGRFCDIHGKLLALGKDAKITIGDYTTIRYSSFVGAVECVQIGNHVIISNNVTIYDNNNHPTDPQKRIEMTKSGFNSDLWHWKYSAHKPVVIKDNVWIGEKSVILKGVTIGEGAVVGCCSVVTKDVAPYTVVAGNPAREVKRLN